MASGQPQMNGEGPTTNRARSRWSIGAAIAAAIAASVCCLGPLVLVSLGATGTWIGSLSALEPVRPLFILLTGWLLGYAFARIKAQRAEECGPDGACTVPKAKTANKIGLWVATLGIAVVLMLPAIIGAANDDGPQPLATAATAVTAVATETAPAAAAGGVAAARPTRAVLSVPSMTCGGCTATVKGALSALQGVEAVSVDLHGLRVTVDYDADAVTVAQLTAATGEVGYPSTVATSAPTQTQETP